MFPDFTLFGEKTGAESRLQLEAGLKLFGEFISTQPVLRTLISETVSGIGHQAATVNIIRRLASPVASRPPGFNYSGTVEIWADMTMEGIRDKLLQLLPELKGRDSGKINNTTVLLRDKNAGEPDDEVLFGFSGADDFPDFLQDDGLKDYKIQTYLLIQPYLWMLGVRFGCTEAQAPGNLVFQKVEETYQLENLDKFEPTVPFHIKDRAYTQPIRNLSDSDWQTIKDLTLTPDEAQLVSLMKTLTGASIMGSYNIVPLYGINYPGETAFRKPVSQRLALEMAIYHTALKDNARIKPPILINFGTYIPGEDASMSLAAVKKLAEGGYTQEEIVAAEGLSALGAEEASPQRAGWQKALTVAGYRNLAFGDADGKDVYRVIDYRKVTSEKLVDLLGWLGVAGKNRVLLIQAARVPSLVFDYTVAVGGLPSVFEGANTAVVAINSGKPYLNTRDPGWLDKPTQYQQGKVDGIDFSGLAKAFQKIANRVQDIYSNWPANPNKSATSVTASFLKKTYPDDEIIFDYFGSVKQFYADGMNDKFSVSAASAAIILREKWGYDLDNNRLTADSMAAEAPDLQALYDAIQSQIATDGSVDVLGISLLAGGIQDYFNSLVADTGGTLVVNNPVLSSLENPDEQLIEVILDGNTGAFGTGTICKFAFTMSNGAYACNSSFEGADPWNLDAVPWIVFERPTYACFSSNAGFSPSGEVKGKLRKTDLELSIALPNAAGIAVGTGAFEQPQSVMLFADFVGGINLEQYIPAPLAALASIGVKKLSFAYDMVNKTINQIILNIGSAENWEIIPGLSLTNFDVQIIVNSPVDLQNRTVEASISGDLLIGSDDKASTILVSATIPELYLSGQLTSPDLPLNTLISVFWSGATPEWPGGNEPKITSLAAGYGVTSKDYSFDSALELNWPITVGGTTILTIDSISLYLMGETGWATGGLSGSVTILPNSENIGLDLTANYLGNEAQWRFSAQQTSGQVSLMKLFTAYMPEDWRPDPNEFDILIDGLGLTIETATNSWEFTGKTAVPIAIPGTGIEVQLNLRMGYNGGSESIGRRDALYRHETYVPVLDAAGNIVSHSEFADPEPGKAGYFGTVSAIVTWEEIEITVFYDFAPGYKSFGIAWGILEGKLISNGETTATLGLRESTTIGSIAETMIGWATGSKFSLSSPWSVLNSIPLNNLQLVYNFTTKQVGFDLDIGPIEMGFARIDKIYITYKSNQKDSDDNGVQVELKGSFRWQQDPGEPLGWDAAKPETTPAPDGQGSKYLELRLLALGQHVTLPCFADANTVQEAIACMTQLPAADPDEIPGVTLDANSSWLIGMDFGILQFGKEEKQEEIALSDGRTLIVQRENGEPSKSGYMITMQIVFNDPNIYALRIKLDGDAAKVLKGLDFQILYKKISDTIGMYKAEITLPDAMRFIRMGQYNITLPVFGIEYYTNGDFQVDIGFPWKADFSRSLTFQTLIWTPIGIPIPVMGSLGVYFGKLSSATTDKVPKADNGTFNPVLVFGFGIQFGIGYTFEAGILKAGFSLTAVAILEGVVAKFNPYALTDGAQTGAVVDQSRQTDQVETSYYFWLQGTVGIIGKLFGSIDFAIIKAEVNIDIRLLASFTFAPYEPIVLNLSASVEVELKVKINLGLFKITISLSFSARISQSVTIKAIGNNPPWHVSQEQQSQMPMMLVRRRPRRRGLPDRQMVLKLQAATAPNWGNLAPATDKTKLTTYMTLGLTMAGDQAKTPAEQLACYVAAMFIDSVPPPQEDRVSGLQKAFATATDSSFEVLSKMVLRWAVASIQSQEVTAEQVDEIIVKELELQVLLDSLSDENNPTPIPGQDIEGFLAGQFSVVAEGPTRDKQIDATYFPVAPAMKLNVPAYGGSKELDYSFAEYNATSEQYLEFLRNYFNQLMVKVQEEDKQAGLQAFTLDDDDGESLGSFIFNDYFLMLCRQMLQLTLDSLREFKYYLKAGQTSDEIVAWVNLNAGLSGTEAYGLEELFSDNAGVTLTVGKNLKIDGATYVVQANDTFDSIAARTVFGASAPGAGFDGATLAKLNSEVDNTLTPGITIDYPGNPYVTQPSQSLATVADEIGVSVDELISNGGIASLANLPLAVSTLKVPPFTHSTTDGETLRGVAAQFRIDQSVLAATGANGVIPDLFDAKLTDSVDIANLTQFKTGELIREIQATQGLQHLSGMTSRYYMAGLRLPTDGITPKKLGMWVTGDEGHYQLPEFAGLYALTGQQFEIPTLNDKDDFVVELNGEGVAWLSFENSDPNKLPIAVKPGTNDRKQIDLVKGYATTHRLDTGLVSLGVGDMFSTKEATYSFNSEIDWNAASAFEMPWGGKPPGVPDMQLWMMPDSLMSLPDLSNRKVNPRMAMKIGEHNEAARAMVDRDLDYYGYASVVEFTVKKVPVVPTSPSTQTTYEVMGADGNSARVLEEIVSEIGDNESAIQTLILAFSSDPNSTTSSGIQTDAEDALTLGLAQVNLSTETRPDTAFNASLEFLDVADNGMTLLNDKTEFVRLLWEASITRAGGYYLYYFNSDSKSGLPDRVFNDKDETTLTLVVLYSKPVNVQQQGEIGSYMNSLVTGESIDRNSSQLFAEANPDNGVRIAANSTQTLSSIAWDYFGNVSQVAVDNIDLPLRNGLQLTLLEGTYEVGPADPGGDLNAIAAWFGITVADLKSANPKMKSWPDPLPQYTALYLPAMKTTVSQDGPATLGDVASYYGMNLTALASHNRDLPGPFAAGGQIVIGGGPVITTATVPPGNVNFEAIRPKPEEIPDKPEGEDYGLIFLRNIYSLLSCQVDGNEYFSASRLGLPAGPVAEPGDVKNVSKVRVPKAIAAGEDWSFQQAVPYNQFSLQTPAAASNGLPDQNDSPYKGIGDLLQVDFAWQDVYGNRLITELSNPVANDTGPLNEPPVLTGYTDPIIGLNQWPSVASTYAVVDSNGTPTINLNLTFDSTVYQGMIGAEVKTATTIAVTFTEELDKTSAERVVNYSLDNDIKVTGAQLAGRTVTLTVDSIPDEIEITLTIADIQNLGKTQTFPGVATFYSPTGAGEPTSTLLQKAKGDLNTYTQLWYQLKDAFGIEYRVATSLTSNEYRLDDTQVAKLVDGWVASIWTFVKDRSEGGVTAALPAAACPFSFEINETNLNASETYRLELGFTIERTGGAVMGDLETTGGIASVTTPVSPYAGKAGDVATDLSTFAKNFEDALAKTGEYELRVATSVDRETSLSGNSGNELWVVRLGLNQQTSISYDIENVGDPMLFAPKPISNSLENRTGVPIWDFNPETGIDFSGDPSRSVDFTAIDMDLWGQQFFGDVDNVLSPEFTAAIQLVDNNKGSNFLGVMLENKKQLADVIKNWMDFVFTDEAGSTDAIREAFRQQVLVKLSNAYQVKAGVQYTASVQAGAFRLHYAGASSEDPRTVELLFTGDIDSAVAENLDNYWVSDNLEIETATLDNQNPQIVTLTLNGPVMSGETEITLTDTYQDFRGTAITPPLRMAVAAGSAATPEVFGNIQQNFKFNGSASDTNDKTKVFLYFSGDIDQATAQTISNYTVSGLVITNAELDADGVGLVTLTLSGEAVDGQTTVTVSDRFTNAVGQPLMAPYVQTVRTNVDVSHRAQGLSISAAKVNLKNSDSVPVPFLVSGPQLVRTEGGAILSYIDLDTSFQGSSIEHQIGTLPNVADYRASTWLSFLNDLEPLDANLGSTQVPMVLRSFPASPSMVTQTGESTYTISTDDLDKILKWNYLIDYSQTIHYPQDELYFTVHFNVKDGDVALEAFQDAFAELAEFITVYPSQIEPVFRNSLIKIDGQTSDQSEFDASAIALDSFNKIVARIVAASAGGMQMAKPASVRVSNSVDPYIFQLREGFGTVGAETEALVITIIGEPPEGVGDPLVEITGYTTRDYTGQCNGDFCYYFEDDQGDPLPASVGQGIGPRRVKLPEMNILERQDAETTVELKRNVDLVPGKTTREEFVYTTGPVGFANPLFPLIVYDNELPVQAVGGGSRFGTLDELLTNFFQNLLAENEQDTLSFLMTCTYAYQQNPIEPTVLPVMMQPKQTVDVRQTGSDVDTTLLEMIDDWSKSILLWFDDHKTSTDAGVLHFDLTIFTNLTEQNLPLLRLTSMVLALEFVTDIGAGRPIGA